MSDSFIFDSNKKPLDKQVMSVNAFLQEKVFKPSFSGKRVVVGIIVMREYKTKLNKKVVE